MGDRARGQIDGQLVAVRNVVGQGRTLQHGQALVDRVPKEHARERLGDDGPDTGAANRAGGLLARAAAAKIVACDDELVLPYARWNVLAENLEDVLRQLIRVDGDQVARVDDDVGVHVVVELDQSSA